MRLTFLCSSVAAGAMLLGLQETRAQAPVAGGDTANMEARPVGAEPCPIGTLKVQEDRFSGHAQLVTTAVHDLTMNPALGWTSAGREVVALILSGASKRWRYLDCPHVAVLADGKRLKFSEPKHKGTVTNEGVIEQFTIILDWEAAQELSRAGRVEYKVCNDEYVAPQSFLCTARDFTKAVGDWKASNPGR